MDKPSVIDYALTHQEIWITQRYTARYVIPRKRRYRFWIFFAVLALCVVVVGDVLFSQPVQDFLSRYLGESLTRLVPAGLALLLLWALRTHLGRWVQMFFNKDLETYAPLATQTFSVGEERLEWKSRHFGSWLGYEAIDRILLTPETLGIVSGGSVICIPRRAIGENSEISHMINFIFSRLGEQARLSSLQDKNIQSLIV